MYCLIVFTSSSINVFRSSGSKHMVTDFVISFSFVSAILWTRLVAAFWSCYNIFGKNTVHDGFFGFSDNDKISSIRGTPRVTFDLDATPAKLNVLSVNCVVGSPIYWAAIMPTISPGLTIACLYMRIIVSRR